METVQWWLWFFVVVSGGGGFKWWKRKLWGEGKDSGGVMMAFALVQRREGGMEGVVTGDVQTAKVNMNGGCCYFEKGESV